VELVTAFTWEHKVPMVAVKAPGTAAEVPLDEFNLQAQSSVPAP
jgi:hypothetical protein